jgi:hypothetical protein
MHSEWQKLQAMKARLVALVSGILPNTPLVRMKLDGHHLTNRVMHET